MAFEPSPPLRSTVTFAWSLPSVASLKVRLFTRVGLQGLAVEAVVEVEVAGGAVGLLGIGVEQALEALRVDGGVIRVRLGVELLDHGLRAGIGRQRGGEAEPEEAEGEDVFFITRFPRLRTRRSAPVGGGCNARGLKGLR